MDLCPRLDFSGCGRQGFRNLELPRILEPTVWLFTQKFGQLFDSAKVQEIDARRTRGLAEEPLSAFWRLGPSDAAGQFDNEKLEYRRRLRLGRHYAIPM